MGEKETAKQRIVDATMKLICLGRKPSEITVADITEEAGVGNGMVNYHFQSKDNLMRTAVKQKAAHAKKVLPEIMTPYMDQPAEERLIILLKEMTGFFAENTEVSKIAILDNLENDDGSFHLLSDVAIFNDCLDELCGGAGPHKWIKNYSIAGFLNFIFLKAPLIKAETGFDFYSKAERDWVVEHFVRDLFHGNVTDLWEECGK
jgi:AcrR family transcriptional regulator